MKHLVLLGSGPSHLRLLHELATSPLPGAQVTMVAPHGRHVAASRLAAWVAGRCTEDECVVPLAPLARKAGIQRVDSDALDLHADERRLALANGHTLAYDALSIDVPAVADRDLVPGARENALFARPFDHFLRLWNALVALAEDQSLNVVVVGGEVPAIELALAVHLRLGKRVRVALVTGGGAPVPGHPLAFQERVRSALKAGQVTLFEDGCEGIFGNQMLLSRGLRLACDAPLLAMEPGPPRWAPDSGLARDAAGFLLVGPTLQSASHPEVFACGEVAALPGLSLRSGLLHDPWAKLPLALNLRRFLAGGALQVAAAPQPRLHGVQLGDGRALLGWGNVTAAGRVPGWWAERVARRSVRGLKGADDTPSLATSAPDETQV